METVVAHCIFGFLVALPEFESYNIGQNDLLRVEYQDRMRRQSPIFKSGLSSAYENHQKIKSPMSVVSTPTALASPGGVPLDLPVADMLANE